MVCDFAQCNCGTLVEYVKSTTDEEEAKEWFKLPPHLIPPPQPKPQTIEEWLAEADKMPPQPIPPAVERLIAEAEADLWLIRGFTLQHAAPRSRNAAPPSAG
jgi:hypothetical protein